MENGFSRQMRQGIGVMTAIAFAALSGAASGEASQSGQPTQPAGQTASKTAGNQDQTKGSQGQAMRVKVDQLEDNPRQYIAKTITVDAEVEEVYGPRLFTIDEPNWGDLAGEIFVFVPSTLAALVRENDRVMITGTVKPFVRADVEREWGWLEMNPEIEVEFTKKPVLVASHIVAGNENRALVIDVKPGGTATPVGTTGGSSSPLKTLSALANGTEDLVGRRVDLGNLRVDSLAKDQGFFVKDAGKAVFVLPGDPDQSSVKANETVSLSGVVLQMPKAMKRRVNMPSGGNDDIYIFATNVNKR